MFDLNILLPARWPGAIPEDEWVAYNHLQNHSATPMYIWRPFLNIYGTGPIFQIEDRCRPWKLSRCDMDDTAVSEVVLSRLNLATQITCIALCTGFVGIRFFMQYCHSHQHGGAEDCQSHRSFYFSAFESHHRLTWTLDCCFIAWVISPTSHILWKTINLASWNARFFLWPIVHSVLPVRMIWEQLFGKYCWWFLWLAAPNGAGYYLVNVSEEQEVIYRKVGKSSLFPHLAFRKSYMTD